MSELFLRGLSRWQADTQREAVADVYVASYNGAVGGAAPDREGFLRRLEDHVQRPGFEMVLAGGDRPVGCAYGFRADRSGVWWPDFPEGPPLALAEVTSSPRAFVVAELMVVPDQRRRHIATRLQQHLLARWAPSPAVALLPQDNAAAEAAYQTWGWSRTGSLHPVPPVPPLDLWTHRRPPG